MECYLSWLAYRNQFYKRFGYAPRQTTYADWLDAWKHIHNGGTT